MTDRVVDERRPRRPLFEAVWKDIGITNDAARFTRSETTRHGTHAGPKTKKETTMKLISLTCAAAAAMALSPAAMAQFAGTLAPATWTTSITGPSFGSLVNTSAAPASVSIRGGDDSTGGGCPDGTASGFIGGCQISWSHLGPLNLSFNWSYSTSDISPQYDSFGMLVDGVRIELVANGGNLTQSGSAVAKAVSSFGWYINCSDCTGGASIATISGVSAVPEPATVALLALGLAGIAMRTGRARKNNA